MQHEVPPAFILENSAVQHNFNSEYIRTEVYDFLCKALGHPVTFDAAQLGSYAHRLRNYWSNIFYHDQVTAVLALAKPPLQYVRDILDSTAIPKRVQRTDTSPFWLAP